MELYSFYGGLSGYICSVNVSSVYMIAIIVPRLFSHFVFLYNKNSFHSNVFIIEIYKKDFIQLETHKNLLKCITISSLTFAFIRNL